MKRFIALVVACTLCAGTLTGCYGKFALTRTLYAANGSLPDKYLRSGLTWIFVIFPVYQFAALLDFLVFNTIEFWSGQNPVAAGEKNLHYAAGSESWDIHVRKRGDKVTMDIRHLSRGELVDTMRVVTDTVTGASTAELAKNGGKTFFSAWRSDRAIVVRNADGLHIYES